MPTRRVPLGAGVVAMIVLAGCGLATASGRASEDALTPIGAQATPDDRPPIPAIDIAPAGSGWIDDCVRYVQHGAFVGDVPLVNLWRSTGQDIAAVRTICAELEGPDLAVLRTLPAAHVGEESVLCDTCRTGNQH